MRCPRTVERQWERRQAKLWNQRMRHGLQHLESRSLRTPNDVGDIGHGRSGDASRGQQCLPFGGVAVTEAVDRSAGEHIAIVHSVGVRTEPRIRDELGHLDNAADEREQSVVPAGHHQLAVPRGEDLVRRHHGERRPLPRRHGAVPR